MGQLIPLRKVPPGRPVSALQLEPFHVKMVVSSPTVLQRELFTQLTLYKTLVVPDVVPNHVTLLGVLVIVGVSVMVGVLVGAGVGNNPGACNRNRSIFT